MAWIREREVIPPSPGGITGSSRASVLEDVPWPMARVSDGRHVLKKGRHAAGN